MISANYFDGQTARLHPVSLFIGIRRITLSNDSLNKTYFNDQIKLAEPFADAPCVLDFADGARCEIPAGTDHSALHSALAYQPSRVVRMQKLWVGALLALVALIAFALATVEWGIPVLAERLVVYVPESLDKALGEQTLKFVDGRELLPSRLSAQRITEVQEVFDKMKPATSRQPLRLLVRNVPRVGPNALTLPDGSIVMTDAMILLALDKKPVMGQMASDKLAGVFAHEIGHVQHRHSVRAMARASLTVAFSAALFGDFSSIASTAPALVLRAENSRDMEKEADDYAIALLKEKGVSTLPLAQLFEDMVKKKDKFNSAMPRWLRLTLSHLSTHPRTEDRIRELRAAAKITEQAKE